MVTLGKRIDDGVKYKMREKMFSIGDDYWIGGDEGYWLTRSSLGGQASFGRHLAVGNRITISGGDGRPRTLEVVEIASMGAPLLKVAAGGAPVRLVRVTARVVGAPEAGHEELVRFYVEADQPKPAPLPVAAPQAALGGT